MPLIGCHPEWCNCNTPLNAALPAPTYCSKQQCSLLRTSPCVSAPSHPTSSLSAPRTLPAARLPSPPKPPSQFLPHQLLSLASQPHHSAATMPLCLKRCRRQKPLLWRHFAPAAAERLRHLTAATRCKQTLQTSNKTLVGLCPQAGGRCGYWSQEKLAGQRILAV